MMDDMHQIKMILMIIMILISMTSCSFDGARIMIVANQNLRDSFQRRDSNLQGPQPLQIHYHKDICHNTQIPFDQYLLSFQQTMLKSNKFQCSTGFIGTLNPLELTHDKIQDLKAEENFIYRLKKQKQKMEILNNQFQQQDTLISEQDNLIKSLTASNNQMKISLDQYYHRLQSLEIQNAQKSQTIYSMESTIEKLSNQFKRVSEAYNSDKVLAKSNEQKLVEKENSYSKNYDILKESTKKIQKQCSVLKQKYEEKVFQSKELWKSLQLSQKTISKLQQTIKKLQLQNNHLVQKYEQGLDQTSRYMSELKMQNQSLKSKSSSQTRQLHQMKSSSTVFSRRIQQLQAACDERESKISVLQGHLENTLDQIKILEDDLSNRDHLIQDLSHKKQSNSKYRALRKQLMHIRDKEAQELDEMIQSVRQRHL